MSFLNRNDNYIFLGNSRSHRCNFVRAGVVIHDGPDLAVCLTAALVAFWWYPQSDTHTAGPYSSSTQWAGAIRGHRYKEGTSCRTSSCNDCCHGHAQRRWRRWHPQRCPCQRNTEGTSGRFVRRCRACGGNRGCPWSSLPAAISQGKLLVAGLCCWLRVMAILQGWHLPTARRCQQMSQ